MREDLSFEKERPTSLTIRHCRPVDGMGASRPTVLCASLGLHSPVSATGGGEFRPSRSPKENCFWIFLFSAGQPWASEAEKIEIIL